MSRLKHEQRNMYIKNAFFFEISNTFKDSNTPFSYNTFPVNMNRTQKLAQAKKKLEHYKKSKTATPLNAPVENDGT